MAYVSLTASIDNIVIKYQDPVPYPQDTSLANVINAGDLVWYDTANHWIASVDTDAHAATFAGVAMDGSSIQPYTTKFAMPQLPVMTKGIARFKGTSGDTYHDGDSVYQTTSAAGDPQTITNTAGGNTHVLGTIVLPPGITSAAFAAGTLYQVKISPLWPVTMAA
jgi:hypothetical protein